MTDDQGKRLVTLLADMEEEPALALARSMLDAGYDPLQMLALCRQAMDIVGARYEAEEYFLTELMLAGEMLTEISAMARPLIIGEAGAAAAAARASVVIGTVKGDLHDIGKNLVRMMMEGAGYKVIDLGVDVAPEKFVAAVQENPGCIVGLSALLTTTMINMETITKAVKEVAPATVVAVGGAPLTQEFCDKIGADAYSADPQGLIDWLSSRN